MLVQDLAPQPGGVLLRVVVGTLLATAVAAGAWRARALTPDGAVAAVIVGGVCAAAGWGWAAMLLSFFFSSTLLGRMGKERRARRIGGVVEKGGARDARQVLANGGVFTLAAAGSLLMPGAGWHAVGGGALAAAASDTWATEIGSLAPGMPRHVLKWQQVPPGTSGAVTPRGLMASIGGALLIGIVAALAGWSATLVVAAVVGGIAGSLTDSLLGATVQVRRWCDRCESGTEQAVHVCGSPTRVSGGIPGIDNDMVNLFSVLTGAAAAFLLHAVQESRVTQ